MVRFPVNITKTSKQNIFIKLWFSLGLLVVPIIFVSLVLLIWILVVLNRNNFELNYYYFGYSDLLPTGVEKYSFLLPGFSLGLGASVIWFCTLLLSAAFHEFGHGLCAWNENVRIIEFGVVFGYIFPAAYVELNSVDLNSKSIWTQAMILCAGPFHNLFLALMSFNILFNLPRLLSFGYFNSSLDFSGIMIIKSSSPDHGYLRGMVLTEINNELINGIKSLSELVEFTSFRCVYPNNHPKCCQSSEIRSQQINCLWDIRSLEYFTASKAFKSKNVTPRYCSEYSFEFFNGQVCRSDIECSSGKVCMGYYSEKREKILKLKLYNRFDMVESSITFVGSTNVFAKACKLYLTFSFIIRIHTQVFIPTDFIPIYGRNIC
jgi:hypothetical protein